ncbi:MAG: hypothetical protein HC892_09140 [Saprospiraceae bacterium]|nr:hypothetical protein [Saprospiraceae bacterium]
MNRYRPFGFFPMLTLLLSALLVSAVAIAQPVIDGTFDGESVWGTPKATANGTAGWASANAKKFIRRRNRLLPLSGCRSDGFQLDGMGISTQHNHWWRQHRFLVEKY